MISGKNANEVPVIVLILKKSGLLTLAPSVTAQKVRSKRALRSPDFLRMRLPNNKKSTQNRQKLLSI
jgi:hypothetical protein